MIRTSFLSLLFAAGLGACQQAPKPSSPAPKAEAPRVVAVALSGDWRVTAIDGVPVKAPLVLVLKADANRIWWEPICARMGRVYHVDGEDVTFEPLPPPPGADPNLVAVCAIGLPPRLDEVFAILDGAWTVREVPGGGLLIEAPGRSMALDRVKAS